jgi:hypothetical protein
MAIISKTTFRPSIIRLVLGEVYILFIIDLLYILPILLLKGSNSELIESMIRSITFTQPVILLIFTLPLYFYNTIDIFDTYIVGPSMYGMNWRKISIPINEVIPEDKNKIYLYSIILLGHVILSSKGERINILWLEKSKYENLLEMITQKKLLLAQPGAAADVTSA